MVLQAVERNADTAINTATAIFFMVHLLKHNDAAIFRATPDGAIGPAIIAWEKTTVSRHKLMK